MTTEVNVAYNAPVDTSWFNRIQPWVVVLTASLFFFYIFIQMTLFNALDAPLMRALHINAGGISKLQNSYFFADVIFLFPAGLMLDRLSTRKVLSWMMGVAVVATFGFAFIHSVWQGMLLRFAVGAAGAFCLLGAVRLASRWFAPKRMALVVGFIVTFSMLGGTVAQYPLTAVSEHFGWRTSILLDAAVGLLMLIAIIALVRDFPVNKSLDKEQDPHKSDLSFLAALKHTFRNPQNWLAGIYTSLVNLPIFILGATWGGMYLEQARHLSADSASYVTSMIFVGMVIGSPTLGWLSDKLQQRRMPMIVFGIMALAVVLMIMYIPHLNAVTLGILFFALGFVIASQIISYPLVAESNPACITATSESLASTLIMSGGFLIGLFANLLDFHWAHTVRHGVPIYAVSNYLHALIILPIAFVIAILAAFLVRETNCKSYEQMQKGK